MTDTASSASNSTPFPPRDHPLLADYADEPPLPEERLEGRKEVINPPRKDGAGRSEWYERFGEPYRRGEGVNGCVEAGLARAGIRSPGY